MLDDWYFCSAINLTPNAAHAYLDLLDALRVDESGTGKETDGVELTVHEQELVLVALEQLAEAEPGQLLYAVPDVLAVRRHLQAVRHPRGDDRTALALAAVDARLEEAVALTPFANEVGFIRRGAGRAEFSRALATVVNGRAATGPAGTRYGRAYQDLFEYAPETLLLAVAVDLVEHDPTFRRDGEENSELTRLIGEASTGKLGRAAALHALRLQGAADRETAITRVVSAGGLCWLEPDLMRVVATARFVENGTVDHDGIRAELAEPAFHAELRSATADRPELVDSVRTTIGCREANRVNRYALALWQATLADVAHRTDPAGTVEWLRERWSLTDVAVREASEAPWIRRARARWEQSPVIPRGQDLNASPEVAGKVDLERARTSLYEDCKYNDVLLRLLSATSVALRVVRRAGDANADDPVFLLLLVHAADVLMEKRHVHLLGDLRAGKPPRASENMSAPLMMLALHTKTVIDRLATTPQGVDVRRIAAVVRDARANRPWNTPAGKLVFLAPAMVVVNWILDATSGRTGIAGSGSTWFDVGQDELRAPARTFLRWTIEMLHEEWRNEEIDLKDKDRKFLFWLKRPELLLAQLWPEEPCSYTTDWTGPLRKGLFNSRHKLHTEDVLLNQALPTAKWQELSGLVTKDILGPGADLALMTERLISGLDHEVADVRFARWLNDWQELLVAINDPRSFRRDMRRRMTGVAAFPAPTNYQQGRLRAVLEEVVGSIVEFSANSQNELWELATNLCDPALIGQPEEFRQAMRLRLVVADSLFRHVAHTAALSGPQGLLGQRAGARVRRRIIEHVVHTTMTSGVDAEAELATVWSTPSGALAVPVGTPDARLVRRGAVSNGLVPLFEHMAKQWGNDEGWARGSVAAVDRHEDDLFSVWINCGRGEPVEVETHLAFELGDPVELDQRRSLVRALSAAGPQHGEIREAVVRSRREAGAAGSVPRVLVDGVELVFDEKTPEEAFQRWDPDTSQAFEQEQDADYPVLTEWNAADGWWYPVDRSMAQLVAHLGSRSNRDRAMLTVAATWTTGEGRRWRLGARSGEMFVIGDDDWSPNSLALLAEPCVGLKVSVRLDEVVAGQPRLGLRGSVPLDRRNQDWANVSNVEMVHAEVSSRTANWVVGVDVRGFPVEVGLAGLGEPVGAWWCDAVIRDWNAWHQRTAIAQAQKVNSFSLEAAEDPSRDAFDRIHRLAQGDEVTLARSASRYSDGNWLVRTQDGQVMRAAAESITLRGINTKSTPEGQIRGRVARVVACTTRLADGAIGQSFSLDTFVSCFPRQDEFAALLQSGSVPSMVCAELPLTSDTGSVVTLWAAVNDGPHGIVMGKVPMWMFGPAPQRAGDVVEMVEEETGWALRSYTRTAVVRALWAVERQNRHDTSWFYVGAATCEGDQVDVWQHQRTVVLTPHENTSESWQRQSDARAQLTAGKVESKKFRDPDNEVRLAVRSVDGTYLPGTSLKAPGNGAEVITSSILVEEDGSYVDVRRMFELRHPRENVTAKSDAMLWDAWQKFGKRPDQHLRGKIALNGRSVTVDDLQVCLGGDPRRWSNNVRMADGQQCWIVGAPYVHDQARFVLQGEGNDIRATYAAVTPFGPEGMREELAKYFRFGPAPVGLGTTPLRYAGLSDDEEPLHRFEWGFGLRSEIPADQVRLHGSPLAPGALFFGDVIRRIRIPRDGQVLLDIVEVAVELNPDRMVAEDARKNILHLVDVEVDLVRDTTRVLAVHSRRRGYTQHDFDDSVRIQPHRAVLHRGTSEWLLNRVRAEPGLPDNGPHVRTILVQVEATAASGTSSGPLVLRRINDVGKGKRVFLTPRWIIATGNDFVVEMTLPGKVVADGKPLTVRVHRRDFSQREGLLRNLHRNRDSRLMASVLLVDVFEPKKQGGRMNGKLTVERDLSRNPADLLGLVRSTEGRCYAVVVGAGDHLSLEIRPGAHFWLKSSEYVLADDVTTNSIVRLTPRPDRAIGVSLAVKGDGHYMTDKPRPVVALPKNSLLYGDLRPGLVVQKLPFTIAGLPGEPMNAGSVGQGDAIMRSPHPKFAFVVRSRSRGKLGPPAVTVAVTDVRAGSLVLDLTRGDASVQPLDDTDRVPATWAQLSFADRDARTIEARASSRCWKYHDMRTGHWTTNEVGGVSCETEDITESVSAGAGPLFFAPGWSLRYPEYELRKYGFPVSAVLEGLSEEIGLEPGDYAVAAPVRPDGGLWVETFPGRVLEISGELLAAGSADDRPLAGLDWGRFSTGDEVELRLRYRGDDRSELPYVSLTKWTPGPRGAFGFQRVLVPFVSKNITAFSVLLGAGVWKLTLPVAPQQMPTSQSSRTMWLSAANELTECSATDRPAKGDVVLLKEKRDGEFGVHGLDVGTVRFRPSGKDGWLAQVIRDRTSRGRFFALLRGALPVTVEAVTEDVLDVSSRCQLFGSARPETDLLAGVLGLVTDRLVLLRAGATLLTIDIDRLVPDLPRGLRRQVVDVLAAQPGQLWFHAGADGELVLGVADVAEERTRKVELHDVLGSEDTGYGVLCRDPRALRWYWLPASELGWVTGLTVTELKRFVAARREMLTCAALPKGRLSVRAVDEVARRGGAVTPGDVVRVEVVGPRDAAETQDARYLAVLYQTNVLVEFEHRVTAGPESKQAAVARGDLMETEVEVCVGDRVRVVPLGRRLTKLDLPKQLIASLMALSGSRKPHQAPVPVDRTLSAALEAGGNPLSSALADWLAAYGRIAVGLEPGELDLTEVLSAVLALDLLCPVDDDSKGRLAVWLAWRTGLAAMRSVHVEPIVVQWLSDPDRLRSRRWQRLPVVGKELGERMSASEMGVLLSFCRGILGRVAVLDEEDLQEVARALLIATGHLGPRDGSVGMTGALGRVSALGRALTPGRDETTAQTRLLPQQKTLIRTALSRGRTECGLPLLAQLSQLTPEQQRIATQLLADAL